MSHEDVISLYENSPLTITISESQINDDDVCGKYLTSNDQITTLILLFEFLQLLHCMSTGQLYVIWSSFVCRLVNFMSFGQVLYVDWSTLCHLVKFCMSTGQRYVVWSTLCHLVKFCMSTGQLYVIWSSFVCRLVNVMSSGQLYVIWSSFICQLVNVMSFGQVFRPPCLQRYVSRLLGRAQPVIPPNLYSVNECYIT